MEPPAAGLALAALLAAGLALAEAALAAAGLLAPVALAGALAGVGAAPPPQATRASMAIRTPLDCDSLMACHDTGGPDRGWRPAFEQRRARGRQPAPER